MLLSIHYELWVQRLIMMQYQLVIGFIPRVEDPTSCDPSLRSLLQEALEIISSRLKATRNIPNINIMSLSENNSRKKKDGYFVTMKESRLIFRKDQLYGTVNSLDELNTKVGWDVSQLKSLFNN